MGFVSNYLNGVIKLLNRAPEETINQMAELVLNAYNNDKTVFIMGNGGSAATASHLACDLQKGIRLLGGKSFRVMALNDSMPLMTAWANDFSYADVFAQQLSTWVKPDDLVIIISGSGRSMNAIKAAEAARNAGAVTIALVGFDGGDLGRMSDYSVVIASEDMQQIEDAHMVISHLVMRYIAYALENGESSRLLNLANEENELRKQYVRHTRIANRGRSGIASNSAR